MKFSYFKKRDYLFLITIVCLINNVFSQSPQSFNYQTVIRDGLWNPIANQSVGIQISILEASANGNAVYIEEHNSITSQIGLVNLAIGEGTVSLGNFDSINWGTNAHFIQIEVDIAGGTNYVIMGTTQLRSVPYALFAENSNNPGPQGPQGNTGSTGANGLSAYEVWIANGNTGTQQDFLDSLQGATGLQGNTGSTGANGLSAYEVWIANGNTGTQQDFLDSLQGTTGPQGATGPSFFSKMEGGKVDIGSEVGLGIKIISVTFPTPFSTPPLVICTASAQPGTIFDDSFNITTRSITTTGFEMIVNRVDSHSWSQDLDAHWMAFEY